MAYVVGFLSEEEEQTLKARGWEFEPSPRELVPTDPPTFAPDDYKSRFKMVWLDAGMFEIVNGPDREAGNTRQEGKAPSEVTVAESATNDKQASNSRND